MIEAAGELIMNIGKGSETLTPAVIGLWGTISAAMFALIGGVFAAMITKALKERELFQSALAACRIETVSY